jgi:hypothetical protein
MQSRKLLFAACLTILAGQASAALTVRTCTTGSIVKFANCYVGYNDESDHLLIFYMKAHCKMEFPYPMGSAPQGLFPSPTAPREVTVFISLGPCPEGYHAWWPRVYFDFRGLSNPDQWLEFPQVGEYMSFVCYAKRKSSGGNYVELTPAAIGTSDGG